MLRALYTKTNRYNISYSDLESFRAKIKNNVIQIVIDNETYLTDGQSYYKTKDFEEMLEGKLFPFPEHVSLINKFNFTPNNIEEVTFKLTDALTRPRSGSGIYD